MVKTKARAALRPKEEYVLPLRIRTIVWTKSLLGQEIVNVLQIEPNDKYIRGKVFFETFAWNHLQMTPRESFIIHFPPVRGNVANVEALRHASES